MTAAEKPAQEPIAIIGMSCRYPGARDTAALWRLIADKQDGLADYPGGRSPQLDAFYEQAGAVNRPPSRRGGFLPDADKFDAAFFEISPREAEWTDPQQRLLLETAFEAFEDAGQTLEGLAGSRTGVFVGAWTNEYEVHANANSPVADFFNLTGGPIYGSSSRIAYQFDLRGPDISVNAACAASLAAIHLATRSLRAGECSMAVAGGVNMIFRHEQTQAFSRAKMLASDGRCKFGDAGADGIVRSEGVGLLVLKRMTDAQREGDRVLGLILGTAVSNGGRGGGSISAPSEAGQRQAMLDALSDAGVEPAGVQYVEAHGTGSRAGDPVELAAIASVYGSPSGRPSPCRIGSVKSNIGHTESAAGVAGIIKTIQAFRHRLFPPTLHVERPNPAIDWASSGIVLEQQGSFWQAENRVPRRAAVNGLALTGMNAHVVLEDAPVAARVETPLRTAYILPISAASETALRKRARDMAPKLEETGLGDLCYTAAVRRSHLAHRLAATGACAAELRERLEAYSRGQHTPFITSGIAERGRTPKVAFVFPGQGSQWIGMGRELLRTEPVFHRALEALDREIQKETGWSVLKLIEEPAQEDRLARIDVIQPTLFAMEIALTDLWKTWGIAPSAVVGHGFGEVAAAQVAGILSLTDAVKIICRRSVLLKRVAGLDAAAVVDLPRDEVERAILGREDRISIAVSNSPRSTVLAGDRQTLKEVVERLEEQGVFCRWERVEVASHSSQMNPLKNDLLAALTGVQPHAGTVPLCSTVCAAMIDGAQMDASYWAANLRQTVEFSSAIQLLMEGGFDTFVEMSPHPILAPFIEQTAAQAGKRVLAVGSLRRGEPETATLLAALGQLYARGQAIDWRAIYPVGNQLTLSQYPWQRERFWIESSAPAKDAAQTVGAKLNTSALLSASVTAPAISDFAGRLKFLPPKEARGTLAAWLREQTAAVLGLHIDRVLPDKTLESLGLDSLTAMELNDRVERGLGLQVSASMVWNYATITALASHLESLLAAQVPGGAGSTQEQAVLPQFSCSTETPKDVTGQSAADMLEAELLGAETLLGK